MIIYVVILVLGWDLQTSNERQTIKEKNKNLNNLNFTTTKQNTVNDINKQIDRIGKYFQFFD